MASQRTILYSDWRDRIHIIVQCEVGHLASALKNFRVREKTRTRFEKGSREASKGGKKMYSFRFIGGSKKLDNANYKFHVFIVDTNGEEHHIYGATKNGLVNKVDTLNSIYESATPVVKVFSATSGFGVPKEFFSYFIMLSPHSSKQINILPLGFNKLTPYRWVFSGVGRFMKKDEVKKFFGADSDTWKFYLRQSLLSRFRLSELVHITEATPKLEVEDVVEDPVRLLRFD